MKRWFDILILVFFFFNDMHLKKESCYRLFMQCPFALLLDSLPDERLGKGQIVDILGSLDQKAKSKLPYMYLYNKRQNKFPEIIY